MENKIKGRYNKKQLINELARGIKKSDKATQKILDNLSNIIKFSLSQGEIVDVGYLFDFGPKATVKSNIIPSIDEKARKAKKDMYLLRTTPNDIPGKPLRKKRFLIILHFLWDLTVFLDSCMSLGMDPKESILFKKSYLYPEEEEIEQYLGSLGFDRIHPLKSINKILAELNVSGNDNKPIIIIEDGGYIVPRVHNKFTNIKEHVLGAVEQTTKGIRRDEKVENLDFPVHSVAGSALKVRFEPYHIAKAVLNNIRTLTGEKVIPSKKKDRKNKKVSVIGFGSIGKEIAESLNRMGMEVTIYDKDYTKLIDAFQKIKGKISEFPQLAVKNKDLIIGATGETSINEPEFFKMKNNTYLVSASSDRLEINYLSLGKIADKVTSLKEGGEEIGTRYKIGSKAINLLAKGYPINFWGSESLPNRVSDMIMSLIFISAVDIAKNNVKLEKKIYLDRINKLADKYKLSKRYLSYYGYIDKNNN